jgi:hypothetical protein
MATDDDDILTGLVPDPDAAPTAAERAHARTFAELVDKTLAGRTPLAMSADDRALLEVATVIRATSGGLPLAAAKQHALIEDVLRQAVGVGVGVGAGAAGASASRRPTASAVTPIERSRARRWAPWAIAGASTLVAAAAIAMFWLRTPAPVAAPVAEAVPARWTSRPTDPLIGPIPRARAGDASARLDYIFADRLDGFRERRLSPRVSGSRGGKP